MRRMAFAGVMVAVLAAGLASLTLGGRSGGAARAASVSGVRRATRVAPPSPPSPSASVAGGSTCFVGVPYCSESPCTEFVAASSSTVYVVPAIHREQPIRGCSGQRHRSQPAAVARLGKALPVITARLAHRLAARPPGALRGAPGQP